MKAAPRFVCVASFQVRVAFTALLPALVLVMGCKRQSGGVPDAINQDSAPVNTTTRNPGAPEQSPRVEPLKQSAPVVVKPIPGSSADAGSFTGPAGGGAIGPMGPVFGNGGYARRIVFLCDASAPMLNKMPTLKDQVSKTISNLRPVQTFDVIFFQGHRFDSFMQFSHQDGLVAATPQAKRSAAEFLEGVAATGSRDPIAGINAAFKAKPQLIYLLADGDFPDNAAVLKTIRDLNNALPAKEKVKINTIAFVGEGDNDVAFVEVLKTIAKETGGTFRHVKEPDL